MQQRGAGSIFGTEQKGSPDIGADLQRTFLTDELAGIKEKIILPSKNIFHRSLIISNLFLFK